MSFKNSAATSLSDTGSQLTLDNPQKTLEIVFTNKTGENVF